MKSVMPIILAILFTSCSQVFDTLCDARNCENIDGMELYYGDFSGVESPDTLGRWIYRRIEYKMDYLDHWQSPQETLDLGTGDCEDMAILYINILYVKFGIKSDLALVQESRQVVNGGKYNHAVVSLPDGRLISAQGGRECHEKVRFIYTFDEIFKGDL